MFNNDLDQNTVNTLDLSYTSQCIMLINDFDQTHNSLDMLYTE